ncbi:MAG: S-layer homology domain-containing protein, partial [Erysipelotrichaceae bacterium]|nr:S-layer homology domain-containing protein [Erysipelotrichaceae bacterium]
MIVNLVPSMIIDVLAAEVTGFNVADLSASHEGEGTWTGGNATLSGSVTTKVTQGCAATSYDAQSTTLTLTYTGNTNATVLFDYTYELNKGSITIDSVSATDSSFSKVLAKNETIKIVLTSDDSAENTTSISLTNIQVIPEINVTTTFIPGENGTYTVDGETISTSTTYTKRSTESYDLIASPVSGYKLAYWYDVTNESVIATAPTYSLKRTSDSTVQPVFIPSNTPVWEVGTKVFHDLNDAIDYSVSSNTSVITLISSGTLAAGEYTIPSGKTVLIPMDASKEVVGAVPEVVYGSYSVPSAYSLLTMASGASITVANGGSLSVASRLSAYKQMGGYNGCTTGPDGRIMMESGSSITVQNNGKLYCWGYIYGSGSVVAESGSALYEAFQIKDWRGGTATSNSYDYTFIFSQYYVQNIEVPLTMYAGATETVYSSVNASGAAYPTAAVFIGSGNALFTITNGYLFRDYIESEDRNLFEVHGDVAIAPMTLTGLPVIDHISTTDYDVPITSNIDINIVSGTTTINQNIKLLPSVNLTIGQGAVLNISSGKKVYVYDNDDWGIFTGNARLYVIGYSVANGTTAKRTAAGLKDAKIDVNGTVIVNGNLYTSLEGADITSSEKTGKIRIVSGPSEDTIIYEMANNTDKTEVTFNPARLHNGNTEIPYTSTKNAVANSEYLYCEICDRWDVTHPHEGYFDVTWVNYDGTVLELDEQIEVNNMPVYNGETPVRPNDDEYEYEFSGWDPEINTVSEDITYTATYTSTSHVYNEPVWNWSTDNTSATATFTCSNCGYEKEVTATIETIETVNPTCTVEGHTTYRATVTFNGQNYTNETTATIPVAEHTAVTDAAVPATCTQTGLTEGSHCSVCGEILVAQEVIQALGHDPGEAASENEAAATCTESGSYDLVVRCTRCSEILSSDHVVTEPLGHSWSEWTLTTDPTCTEKGEETRECSRCHITETRDVDALGHIPGEAAPENEVAPTCTEDGSYDLVVRCTRCNEIISSQHIVVEATGHTPVVDPAVEATCTEPGLSEGSHCSVCGEVLVAQEAIPALGHDWSEWSVITEPTCTSEGEKTRECLRCHITESETLPVSDHTIVIDQAVEPTCTNSGLTEGSHCSVCGEVITAQEIIPALGHNWSEWTVTTDPTCTETGEKTRECSRCHETETEPIPALGHDPGEAKHENEVAATCTEDGSYDVVVRCTRCNEILSSEHVTTEALDHAWDDWAVTTDPTCIETGEETRECSRCHETETQPIPALGHLTGEAKHENEVAATCTEDGSYDIVVRCTRCNEILSSEHVTTEALGHAWGDWTVTTEPTCTAAGEETRECTRCHIADTKPIAALGHDWDKPEYTWSADNSTVTATRTCKRDDSHIETETASASSSVTKQPTCTEKGETTYSAEFINPAFSVEPIVVEDIDALGHDPDEAKHENEVAPTCAEDGSYDLVVRCTRCNEILSSEKVTVEALGHDWGQWAVTTEPTCETEGEETRECSRCHETDSKPVEALGHDWNDPTYAWSADNSTVTATRTCKRDDTHIETETVEATASTIPATCESAGSTTYTSASFENEAFEVQSKTETIPASGHDWNDPEYDWSADNSTVTATRTCKNGDHPETETVQTSSTVTKDPTCTEKGETTYSAEFINPAFSVEPKVVEDIDALGHDPGEAAHENETAPTCSEDGSYDLVVRCTRCNEILSSEHVVVNALGHTVVIDEAVEPTCTETGLTEGSHCSVCHEVLTAQEIIPALGHDYQFSRFIWADDNKSAMVELVCSHDENHKDMVEAEMSHEQKTEATCEEAEVITYTATYEEHTESRDAEGEPALGHRWGTPSITWNPLAEGEQYPSGATASRTCLRDPDHVETVDCTITVVEQTDRYIILKASAVFPDGIKISYTKRFEIELPKTVISLVFMNRDGIELSWESTGADKYDLYRDGVLIATVNRTTYVDNVGRTMGQRYVYTVCGVFDDQQSGYSNELSVLYNPFCDVEEGTEDFTHVAWAYNNDIIGGVRSGNTDYYKLQNKCTRAQFAVMLYKMNGLPSVSGLTSPFEDIADQLLNSRNAIIWCYNEGIVGGTSPTTFDPKGNIKRSHLIIM